MSATQPETMSPDLDSYNVHSRKVTRQDEKMSLIVSLDQIKKRYSQQFQEAFPTLLIIFFQIQTQDNLSNNIKTHTNLHTLIQHI